MPWGFRQELERPDGTRDVVFELKVPHSLVPDLRSNPEHAKRDLAAIASQSGVGFFWDPGDRLATGGCARSAGL
jgi:hypothetical protein